MILLAGLVAGVAEGVGHRVALDVDDLRQTRMVELVAAGNPNSHRKACRLDSNAAPATAELLRLFASLNILLLRGQTPRIVVPSIVR